MQSFKSWFTVSSIRRKELTELVNVCRLNARKFMNIVGTKKKKDSLKRGKGEHLIHLASDQF